MNTPLNNADNLIGLSLPRDVKMYGYDAKSGVHFARKENSTCAPYG